MKPAINAGDAPFFGDNEDDPYMQVLVVAEPPHGFTRQGVSVLIEGPKGRDPYFE
jgi:hypothetical protein